jgi:lipoate-protein ligase A
MRQWRLMYDQPTTGVRNMAVDETLLNSRIPTLRLYAWQPFCLSLGYGQRSADVDRARLENAGWDLVRRPSGGRAVLHAEELTYSLALPRGHDLAAQSIGESYRRISAALLLALQSLGAAVEVSEVKNKALAARPVCFEITSQHEILAGGRKLIGSAQLRREAGLLQHGSIPLQGDPGQICEVLTYADETARRAAQQQLRERATNLSQALAGATICWQRAADALVEGFSTAFGVEFCQSGLSEDEILQVESLAERQYASAAWTWRR